MTFSRETREQIIQRDRFRCTQCGNSNWLEIHHIIANTKLNRKLYGDFVQSAENGILVCKKCHDKHSLWDKELKKLLKLKLKEL
jgi:5-methylcytosine-specific restriction endonuclease McrA